MWHKNRKKALVVIHRFWPYLGGAEKHFFIWAKTLTEMGYDIEVFTTNVWDNDFFHYRDKRYIREKIDRLDDNFLIRRFRVFHPINKNNLLNFLSKFPIKVFKFVFGSPFIFVPGYFFYMLHLSFLPKKYDVILAGVFPHYYLIYPSLLYAKRKRIPFICVPLLHFGEPNSDDGYDLFFNEKSREIIRVSDFILTNTIMEKKKLIEEGYEESKIKVAGVGIDISFEIKGNKDRFRGKYGINSPIVLQISTQTHEKGSHHTLEAMKLVWKKNIKVKLVLIGQILCDFENYLLAQDSNVFENTLILDYVDEEEKNDALSACDIFVMPSRADSFGLSYLEAWFYKKPVIAAYCSGVMEVVNDGLNGFLVPFGDYHMLSEYILKLLGDGNLRNRMGANGYNKVLENYTWDRRISSFKEVIYSLQKSKIKSES